MNKETQLLILVSGDVVGGHEMQLKILVEKIRHHVGKITILCASQDTYQYFIEQDSEVHLVNFLVAGKVWHQWTGAGSVAPLIGPHVLAADHVLVSGGTLEACIAASRASKLTSPRIRVTAYMPMYIDRSVSHGVVGLAYNVLANFMARTIDEFLTINPIQAALLRRHTRRPALVVENQIRSVARPTASYGRRLVFVGRFDNKQKGVAELIQLLDTAANPYQSLVLIGDGPDKPQVVAAASRAIHIKVKLLGWMANDAIDSFLGIDDCLIMNSAWEGEPLVVREFNERGLPCIVRRIDGVRGVTKKSMRFSTQSELIEILRRVHGGDRRTLIFNRRNLGHGRSQRVLGGIFGA